jgi:XisI protein
MDKITQYQKIIRQLLQQYAEIGTPDPEIETQFIFDTERNHYQLVNVGSVTTGTNWKFLFIEETTVYIDSVEYYIKEVDKILGILLQAFEPMISFN